MKLSVLLVLSRIRRKFSTFVACKKQQTIDRLRDTVREKTGVLAELQSEMKTSSCTAATEKQAIRDEH